MNSAPLWFERQFDFAFPVEQLPNICARLRGAPPRLEDLVRGVPLDVLTKKPSDGQKWSAQEHAGHLLDLEPLWRARVEDYLTGAGKLTVADLTNQKTHRARHNERPIGGLLTEFRGGRAQMLKRIEGIGPAAGSGILPHPRMKTPMRLVDHLYFVAEHDDHHLAHIWELINRP